MEFFGGLGTADLMQERSRYTFPEIVQELLHPLALHPLGLVETGLRAPERANVVPEIPASRLGHRLAAQLLANLVEQPRAADHTAPNHQAAGAGLDQQRLRLH